MQDNIDAQKQAPVDFLPATIPHTHSSVEHNEM